MVVLRSGVLLLMWVYLPIPPDKWNIANSSGPLLNVAVYVALIELALAAVVAAICGLTLFLAGVLTTADLTRFSARLRRVPPDPVAQEPSLVALETIAGLQHPRRI